MSLSRSRSPSKQSHIGVAVVPHVAAAKSRRLHSDEGMTNTILKCIGTHYNGVYPSWSLIPLKA